MTTLTRRDFRAIILFNWKKGLTDSQCYEEMSTVFSDSSPSLRTIQRWYLNFKRGNFNLEDDERSGRPVSAVTQENIIAVKKLIEKDRRVTYLQIQYILKISAPSVSLILHEHLKVRKLCTLWIPYQLTCDQKVIRVNWSKEMLKKFNNGSSKQINSIVTGDETWVYFYDIPTKTQSQLWIFEDEDSPVQVRQSKSIGKRMFAIFFSKGGLVKAVMLDGKKTVTASWYTDHCLPQVFEELTNRRPKSRLGTWFIHHDNAPAIESRKVARSSRSNRGVRHRCATDPDTRVPG